MHHKLPGYENFPMIRRWPDGRAAARRGAANADPHHGADSFGYAWLFGLGTVLSVVVLAGLVSGSMIGAATPAPARTNRR
jgi:hypothetical protein